MDYTVSAEQVAQLWDRYVSVSKRYVMVKATTDAAEASCQRAREACDAAYDACESAYAEEFKCAQALQKAAGEFKTASDAAFLTTIGIEPSSVLPHPERTAP